MNGLDHQLLSLIREDLSRADYTQTTLETLVSTDARNAVLRGVIGPARTQLRQRLDDARRLPEAQISAIQLARLFLLGESLTVIELADAFQSLTPEQLVSLGIIAPDSSLLTDTSTNVALKCERYLARFSLTPMTAPFAKDAAEWWIFSDLDDHLRGGPAKPDHVMGIGGATRSLIDAIPQRQVSTALEVGTGCGVVALVLASIAESVVAVDISERAIMFGRMNAALNRVDDIEFLVSDLFEAASQDTFQLIVSNPPFVISPNEATEQYVYRSAAEPGDLLLRRMLSEAPKHLTPGGSLVCLANWEFMWGGTDGEVLLKELVPEAGTSLSAWLIERGRQTPVEYASLWLRDGGLQESDPSYEAKIQAWVEDFRSRNTSRICFGYVMLRKEERGFLRTEALAGTIGQDQRFGDAWAEAFDNTSLVYGLDNESLLDTQFVLNEGVEEVRTFIPGTQDITSISFVKRNGIERYEAVDSLVAAALGASDGELTLSEIATALAGLMDTAVGEAKAHLAPMFREYVALGILYPSSDRLGGS